MHVSLVTRRRRKALARKNEPEAGAAGPDAAVVAGLGNGGG
jgi:hypothetical protein